jgi:2-amino-4-hydroxy-6-hydroxymethyldihydropteridine diphosphokinase
MRIVFFQCMNKAYLLIGGNTGERLGFLRQAVVNLEAACGHILKKSSIYETAAWGNTNQEAFLNQALLLQTALTAPELMNGILSIEEKMGRIRTEKYAPRIIDIDILLFNSETIATPQLQVPHPQLAYRRFALMPLKEIAARYQHPVLHKSIALLLNECTDGLEVKKIQEA